MCVKLLTYLVTLQIWPKDEVLQRWPLLLRNQICIVILDCYGFKNYNLHFIKVFLIPISITLSMILPWFSSHCSVGEYGCLAVVLLYTKWRHKDAFMPDKFPRKIQHITTRKTEQKMSSCFNVDPWPNQINFAKSKQKCVS